MEGLFISTIAMIIPDNSIKNWDNLKDLQNLMLMMSGHKLPLTNGCLKKMHKWS